MLIWGDLNCFPSQPFTTGTLSFHSLLCISYFFRFPPSLPFASDVLHHETSKTIGHESDTPRISSNTILYCHLHEMENRPHISLTQTFPLKNLHKEPRIRFRLFLSTSKLFVCSWCSGFGFFFISRYKFVTNYVGIHGLQITRSNKLKSCSQTQWHWHHKLHGT